MYSAAEKATDPLLSAMAEMETRLIECIDTTNERIDTTNANMQEQFASVRDDFSEHREEVKQLLNGQDRSSV